MPRVLPDSSVPGGSPTVRAANERRCSGRRRASASIRKNASSATACALAPGTFRTAMPRAAAASRSTLSRPAPNWTIAFRFCAAAITDAVIRPTEGTRATTSATCSSRERTPSTTTRRSPLPFEALGQQGAAAREAQRAVEDGTPRRGQGPYFFSGRMALKVAVSYESRSFITSVKGSIRIAS